MKYIIGIDGGATKSLLKLADSRGKLVVTCQGGPSNIYSSNLDVVSNNLQQIINEALTKAKISKDLLSSVCLGTAGAGRESEKNILTKILREIGLSCRLTITHDAIPALYGAFGKGEGIILISGTGSVCYGRKKDGSFHRTGGFGHIIGDEGSGYDIGRRILTQVMWGYDGRGARTVLTKAVMDQLNMKSPEELVSFVYSPDIGKSEIAALAKLLDVACSEGDETALLIAEDAAMNLFFCINSVVEKLNFTEDCIHLAMQGSILEKGIFVKQKLISLLKKNIPMLYIKTPKADAAWGAVLMALDEQKYQS